MTADITSIEDYRRRRKEPEKKRAKTPSTPRGRSVAPPSFDVEEVLRHLESIRGEVTHRLLDSLEEAALDRFDQVRRFGLGLSRRISVAVARKVNHDGLREFVCAEAENPKLELRRGLHVRMLHIPVTPEGRRNPIASAYLVLIRGQGMLTIVIAAVKEDGTLAETRQTLRRPCDVIYWSRDAVDQFLRRYLRDLFEELEADAEAGPGASAVSTRVDSLRSGGIMEGPPPAPPWQGGGPAPGSPPVNPPGDD